MRKIGLIGGMSWQSTLHYYKKLNEGFHERMGGMHSAPILLESLDFQPIAAAQERQDWESIGQQLAEAARSLEIGGAGFLAICSNTVHAAASYVTEASSLPLLHIADSSARALHAAGIQTVGFIGTAYSMQSSWYRDRLQSYGITMIVPENAAQQELQRQIFEELCFGNVEASSKEQTLQIIGNLHQNGAEGVLLGCTEFSMMIKAKDVSLPLFDSTGLHVQEILAHTLQ
ncbi:aspartate/glutamate racemase family protein [Salibacterium aidingense]|uniref:aspartate/glutamate racemase family protein n=1 Tax=Salibacterium aidingense TaxID=384933 RepID=UPI003BBA895C